MDAFNINLQFQNNNCTHIFPFYTIFIMIRITDLHLLFWQSPIFFKRFPKLIAKSKELQSRTKLLEKVLPIMCPFLCNKTISKTTGLWIEIPFPQFNVASYKRPGIRVSFEYTTTLLSREGGEGRAGTATTFRKMLCKYTIFSTVLSKIVDHQVHL